MTEGLVGEGFSSWNALMARTTAGTGHFQDADCKHLGRDSRFSGLVSFYCYSLRLLGVSVAKMGGEHRPLSALKCISELPEPGPAANMAKAFFLCDGHS